MKRVRVKRKKRRGGGKAKGSAFERMVCKQLSLWVSKGSHEDLFWRSAMSGGRATVHGRKGKVVRQAGDICAVSEQGHGLTNDWFIECKHYKHIDFGQWIVNNNGKLAKWWATCKKNARRYGREPMLIAKQNGWPILVITRMAQLDRLIAYQVRVMNRNTDVSLFTNLLISDFTRCQR